MLHDAAPSPAPTAYRHSLVRSVVVCTPTRQLQPPSARRALHSAPPRTGFEPVGPRLAAAGGAHLLGVNYDHVI